jgi:hypothetical protein
LLKPDEISIEKLERIYGKSDHADRSVFAEYRSNVMLNGGYHYRSTSLGEFTDRFRDKQLTQTVQNRLRLTRNHTQK